MKQILNSVRNGRVEVRDVPAPGPQPGEVLIQNHFSVISAGTEKMTIELAKKSLLGKARERPDHVRRVLEKLRNEGFWSTLQQMREKLSTPMTMGYSSAGEVIACGAGVQEYKTGDRVASNGPHADIVSVPKHLVARVPDQVPLDQASFAVLGAIALQGIRLCKSSLGETVLVVGLGLIGQLATSLLRAAGCRVIAVDLDPRKCELALKLGAEVADPKLSATEVLSRTHGFGADAVLITASTASNAPIELAAAAVRQKGRVVLVGVVGLELDRRPFYFKEAEFVVSCSYGPGRYDPRYEDGGQDYPLAHVRWTEQRNIQAVLDAMGSGKLDVSPLISHRFSLDHAEQAYELIEKGTEAYLGILLECQQVGTRSASRVTLRKPAPAGGTRIGILGAGNFAKMVLLPAIRLCPNLQPALICSAGGVSALDSGTKHGFEAATTREDDVFGDATIGAVFSITRHDMHGGHAVKAIRARKHLFVEKPLCLNEEELAAIEQARAEAGNEVPMLMVGFNRRFSPAARFIKEFFAKSPEPLTISIRFNAGAIPADDWTQDPSIGGGRIIGEACHAIDLATFLAGSPPVRVFAECVGGPNAPQVTDDQCFITLRHASGSVTSIGYLAGGDKAIPKERIEVFGGGRVGIIDDFRSALVSRNGKSQRKKWWQQDKGHQAEVAAFANAVQAGHPEPIPWSDLRAVTLASILAVRSLREGFPLEVN